MKKVPIELKVNGEVFELLVPPHRTLLEVLREYLNLTGTKEGCNMGTCGYCIVLMNGQAVNACLVLAVEAQGKDIITIEGLADDGNLHPLQRAWIDNGALNCGMCTPGAILSAKALLDRNPHPGVDDIRRALGNIYCRCGTYPRMVQAISSLLKGVGVSG